MSETPRTRAGRALLRREAMGYSEGDLRDDIITIEEQSAAEARREVLSAVERLIGSNIDHVSDRLRFQDSLADLSTGHRCPIGHCMATEICPHGHSTPKETT